MANQTNTTTNLADDLPLNAEDERKIDVVKHSGLLLIACAIGLIANWVGTGVAAHRPAGHGGALCRLHHRPRLCPLRTLYLPGVAWVSLIAILITIPGVPGLPGSANRSST